MKKKNGTKKNHIKPGASERRLKICAVTISLLFAALMLYPLIFAVSSAMKDNAKIYEVPPQLLPDSANSLSLVIDYSGKDFGGDGIGIINVNARVSGYYGKEYGITLYSEYGRWTRAVLRIKALRDEEPETGRAGETI